MAVSVFANRPRARPPHRDSDPRRRAAIGHKRAYEDASKTSRYRPLNLARTGLRGPVSDAECRIHSHNTTNPAEAGPVLARNQLPLAAREGETGEAEAEKREGGRFGNRGGPADKTS